MGASETANVFFSRRKRLPENKHRQLLLLPPFASSSSSSSSHLKDFLVQAGLLREHLELPGVRVLVDLEVAFHDPQLVVLERSPGALGLRLTHAVGFHAGGVTLQNQQFYDWRHL